MKIDLDERKSEKVVARGCKLTTQPTMSLGRWGGWSQNNLNGTLDYVELRRNSGCCASI